ncbi:MAG: serine/threonine-protein kinase [Gemmatimonadetes bacterium]|nr:serine/threonine-protein kinase [Gemmatimonadota bacterium]
MGLIDHLRPALRDRYRIEDEIGSGGMATVLRARDVKHDRTVAIKVLKEELAQSIGAERFLQEIRIVAKLQHPHILSLLDSGEVDGTLYYVMPFVEGESLRQRLNRENELPVSDALRILEEVADALAFAHQHGVVHRDVKPDNILMAGRHALVADFGVSKAIDAAMGPARVTTAGMAIGTPAYMAPEQAVGEGGVDHRVDVYALGIVGYELLTGRPPFQGRTPQQILSAKLAGQVPSVTQLRPAVPEVVSQILMRCLEERPADRWQTAEELRNQLELAHTSSGETTPWGMAPAKARRGRRWRVGGAAALAVVVLGAGAVLVVKAGVLTPTSGGGATTERGSMSAADSAAAAGRVVITPYRNLTGDASLNPFGRQVATAVERDLTQSAVVRVVPIPEAATDGSGEAATAPDPAKLARDLRVELVVTGEYYLRGDSVEMVSRILKPAAGKVLFNLPGARGPRRAPDAAMGVVAQQVVGATASFYDRDWPFPPELASPPPDLRAFRLFVEGQNAFVRDELASSRRAFGRLRELYPSWLTPAIRQSYAFGNDGLTAQSDSINQYLDAHRDRLTRVEAAQVDYNLALKRGDWEAAYRAARENAQADPVRYAFGAFRTAAYTNRLAEALAALTRRDTSSEMEHQQWFGYLNISVLARLGRYDEALEVARKVRATEPQGGHGWFLEADVLAAMGRREDMEALLAEARAVSVATPLVLAEFLEAPTRVAAGVGRMDDARYYAGQALQEAEAAQEDTRFLRARLLAFAGRWEEARVLLEGLSTATPDNPDLLGIYGWALAMAGRRSQAFDVRKQIEALPQTTAGRRAVVSSWMAAISGALGEDERALEELRQALANGLGFDTWTVWSPYHRPLYDDPRYQSLVAPR